MTTSCGTLAPSRLEKLAAVVETPVIASSTVPLPLTKDVTSTATQSPSANDGAVAMAVETSGGALLYVSVDSAQPPGGLSAWTSYPAPADVAAMRSTARVTVPERPLIEKRR